MPAIYLILYGITFFFQNFGPNSTTYIIPSLIFSPTHKGTCHGISAAFGKLGAILGAYTFIFMTDHYCSDQECDDGDSVSDKDKGIRLSFGICSLIALVGFFWSRTFIPVDIELNLKENLEKNTESSSSKSTQMQNFT